MLIVNSTGNVSDDSALRAINPLVSFPAVLNNACLEPFGYTVLQLTEAPAATQFYTVTQGTPTESNGVWTQTWVQTPVDLASAQTTQASAISSACAEAIVSGFTSNALGAVYSYPSKPTDQSNLDACVTESQLVQQAGGWVASTQVVASSLGQACSVITVNGVSYMCVQSGETGATQPVFPTEVGVSVADGTAAWQVWTTEFWCANSSGVWNWVPHTAQQIQQVGRTAKATIMAYQTQSAVLQAQLTAPGVTTVDQVAAIVWTTPT